MNGQAERIAVNFITDLVEQQCPGCGEKHKATGMAHALGQHCNRCMTKALNQQHSPEAQKKREEMRKKRAMHVKAVSSAHNVVRQRLAFEYQRLSKDMHSIETESAAGLYNSLSEVLLLTAQALTKLQTPAFLYTHVKPTGLKLSGYAKELAVEEAAAVEDDWYSLR